MNADTEKHTDKPNLAEEIRALVGDLDAETVAAIISTGAEYAEIQQAVIWISGEDDTLGKTAHPLTGAAAKVNDILAADPAFIPDEKS
jgi:hypothetical protein